MKRLLLVVIVVAVLIAGAMAVGYAGAVACMGQNCTVTDADGIREIKLIPGGAPPHGKTMFSCNRGAETVSTVIVIPVDKHDHKLMIVDCLGNRDKAVPVP